MRLLVIGFPMPEPRIDNYNPFNAPSFFDYDALVVDPASFTSVAADLLSGEREFEAQDGRPVLNVPTSASVVSAADQLRRRADETQRLLAGGGTVVVITRPNATQSGIVGFEGCDRYSWLPAPAGISWSHPYLRPAEGKTIRIVADDHPFAPLLRDYRQRMSYRAVFDEAQASLRPGTRVIAQGGVGAPVAVEFPVGGGRVLFLPVLPDDSGSVRAEVAVRLLAALEQMHAATSPENAPSWERSVAVPGLEQLEAELDEAEKAVSEASEHRETVQARAEGLRAHRRLVTREGVALTEAVADALLLLGFQVKERHASTLEVEAEGLTAVVECEGAIGEVVEWPYIRLQRRLEERLLKSGDTPRGLIVVNGQRTKAPDERTAQHSDPLRIACQNYHYGLLTGETLFALVRRALGGADEAALSGIRRRLLGATGLIEAGIALGETEPAEDTGPIF
ncbi:MAG: hypothetical protein AB7T37_13750 [Dehalococcoidia bacterium]